VSRLRFGLADHLLRSGRRQGLIFGRSETLPFAHVSLRERALGAWAWAELEPIGLHECRHTFASMCIAAG
jgi:integrase